MTWHVRPGRVSDVDALYELAKMTGGGFTNLPPDRDALAARLARSEAAFAKADDAPADELYMLLLEETTTGRIGGTGALFSRVGATSPFYSYRLSQVSQTSTALGRTISSHVLHLVNDHDGSSEVGALFLHPELRTGGLGRLMARSRYLFIASHRARFGDRILSELRGWLDEAGDSPFWHGLGEGFFGIPFQQADRFNAVHGSQFISDLMPKHPIYVSMLPEGAREVIGRPHDSGLPAMRMLEAEGFGFDGYVDPFDGGPTMCARTDNVRTVRDSRADPVALLAGDADAMQRRLFARGRLNDFRAWTGHAAPALPLTIPSAEAEAHGLAVGDTVRHVAA